MNPLKIAFLDRDGTLIREPPDEQVDRLDKVDLLPGVVPALLRLRDAGYEFVMVSNQDGLGTATFPDADFRTVQGFLLRLLESQGIGFRQIFICPHRRDEGCACRKPRTGLSSRPSCATLRSIAAPASSSATATPTWNSRPTSDCAACGSTRQHGTAGPRSPTISSTCRAPPRWSA
jgi:histidinol-phosphate phosphatase family protein